MSNPLVKKDLIDAILELRADVERQLQANKYYVALNKLDELLAAIRPLEIVEATVVETPRSSGRAALRPPGRAGQELVGDRAGDGGRGRGGQAVA